VNLSPSTIPAPNRVPQLQLWACFSLGIVLLKLLLFAIDPLPKFIMGDSGAYIHTAMTGWIPEARSYFYGYVIRWSSVGLQSLNSLLILQLLLSAVVSILAAIISRFFFRLSLGWAFLFGLLCALDPLQLLYERYVMTEAISLFLYALVLHRSFLYVRDRRLWDLVILQLISVLLIGFRMSYLLVVQLNTVVLPLLAMGGNLWQVLRRRQNQKASPWPGLRLSGAHLLISLLLMFGLHTGYKRANGWISHRPPAYLHATGLTLLTAFSPLLEPEDTSDPELADLIRHGNELGLRDIHLRDQQRFSRGYLIDRFSRLHPERSGAEALAKEAAMNALRRNPLGLVAMAWQVYTEYWSKTAMKGSAEADFCFDNQPEGDFAALLADRFHLTLPKGDQTMSPLQSYYVGAWPYYFVLLLAPLLAALSLIFRPTRKYAAILFIHISVLVAMSVTFGGHSIRYFHPVSFGTLLVIALLANGVRENSLRSKERCVNEGKRGLLHRPVAP
jgi:hypothetical protein